MDYWGGQRVCWPPLSNYWGGLAPPRPPSSYAYDQGSWVGYPVWQHTFVFPSTFSRRVVVSYWRKYVHEVLVYRLGGLSLPRKSVVRLTDRPDMTIDVYRGRKTTMQQQKSLEFMCTHKLNISLTNNFGKQTLGPRFRKLYESCQWTVL